MKPESSIQTAADELQVVQQKVKTVIDRLNASEARIRRLRSDSVSRSMVQAQQVAQIAEYEKSIADLRTTVENQTMELAVLTAQVDSMGRVNVALAQIVTLCVNAPEGIIAICSNEVSAMQPR